MKLTIEIQTQEPYYRQLRKFFHKCVDGAFGAAETNAGTFTVITNTMFGESKFVMTIDKECREAMIKCNACERPSRTKSE